MITVAHHFKMYLSTYKLKYMKIHVLPSCCEQS